MSRSCGFVMRRASSSRWCGVYGMSRMTRAICTRTRWTLRSATRKRVFFLVGVLKRAI